ncbi:thiosulfate sulfurtransferase GlpE [Carnimonas nigrificans]|uniref:thiosulfate sulfurtransferase GlpE n=1 Tax=Carnimonas nigrificans TaxID=64323 RepID=UPI00046F39A6|nr:thiosulfate sulfurtransferase GlpE [Carnimonas nigrificans]
MSFKHLDTDTLAQWLDHEEEVTLVDIRDPVSFADAHVVGATHLDNVSLTHFLESAPKQQPLVVVCYHGHSSQGAAGWLAEQGFSDVYSLDGGFTAWQQRHPEWVGQ